MNTLRLLVTVTFLVPPVLFAQTNPIPNPGFETWSAGAPTNWYANNVPSVYTTITQSTDFRSGSYAAQGTVVDYGGSPVPPFLFAGFPINARYGSLTGYYKLTVTGNDSIIIAVLMMKDGVGYGGGTFETGVNASSYTQFICPIEYANADIPDSAFIEIVITNSTVEHVGSLFKVDDLVFGSVTSVLSDQVLIPDQLTLKQNYPNPFNPTTVIEYSLPRNSHMRIGVFNLLGQEVARLVDKEQSAGFHTVSFDARDLPSGIYLYRLEAAGVVRTKRMILVR